LSSALVVQLIEKGISTYGNRRYLLDGFPRNQENWDEFEKLLADKVVVRNLIYFDCPTQTLIDRMTERSKTSGRSDDNPETMKKRIATFETETVPMVKHFEERNNCIRVDATKGREEVYRSLRDKLTTSNIAPPNPAEMIFVLGGPGSGKGT
jgi:adenylate kinase family enzyme